ncbi:hypothetical protein DUE52_27350 [Larkinella punicea]|uniref:Prevent-host-death protein n=2 Tax=Larkinella punicea TaxID=2315727 RepID=A0A368JF19_9BACT|nr:hypothetical protein DUE52_27350 [Larkinella punicea]
MALQYLSDASGKPTAVVIPIKEWEMLKKRHQDLQQLEKSNSSWKKKPSDFAGTLPADIAEAMQNHVAQSRNEWDRL